MAQLTSQQADDLANQFLALAQAIGDFRYNHWNDLSRVQHNRLASQHWSVLNYGEDILALSTVLIMDDIAPSLASIKKISGQIKSSLGTLKDIQKGIDISAAIVTFGAAIISKSPIAIGEAIDDLVQRWRTLV
ncbi:MAG TPA: hypothetical protein VK517_06100 [Cyclobacteriaceae bacterium]|jgi:hypothetical protein|nr:hypothetical protein [Cyclobacteriaceae bacterium]